MYLTATVPDITVGQASVYALLGYGVVFFGLILLMLVVVVLGKCFVAAAKRQKAAAPAPVSVEPAKPAEAPGSAGQLKLYNVDPKTAAMLMAITAHKMGKPINELRFISVREVSQ